MSGALRQPRLNVLANGAPVAGAVAASVMSNGYYAADRFHVSLATTSAGAPLDGPEMTLEVQFSLDGGATFQSVIEGVVDTVDLNVIRGTLSLSGRDLTAALIEARTQETFANQTASEVATILAGRHGLAAQVAATTTPVGRYWELEHDRVMLNQFGTATGEWDLLVDLAQHEGFDVWVSGSTLYFQPPQSAGAPAVVRHSPAILR
jgi:phage protein D